MIRGLFVFVLRVGGGGEMEMMEDRGESDLVLATGSATAVGVSNSAKTGVGGCSSLI